jgi:hypothetical protein
MCPAAVSLTTVLTVASAIATVVAAVAALVTIHFARQTVDEARAGRRESHNYHEEEMRAARDAAEVAEARHKAELRELEFGRLAGQGQHEENMAERTRASARARDEERLLQLDRISALLLEIIDVARDEARDPPEKLGAAITGTRLPAMLLRLANAVEVLRALGGPVPELAADFANSGYSAGSQAIRYLGEGIDALRDIQRVVDEQRRRNDENES